VLLDSTGAAAGALTEVDDEPAVVVAASDDELEDLDLVFFCGPAAGNRQWLDRAGDDAFYAVDVSQPSSLDGARLAVAGINLDQVGESDRVVVSPHPIAIPIALILHQIEELGRVEICTATVVQPASEFDQAGVEELAQQTIAVLNMQGQPREIFDRQLAFNLYPAPFGNEDFIVAQLRALVDPDTQLALLVTQGTIFHGHTFSLFIKTEQPIEVERIKDALRANDAIALAGDDDQFGTIDAAGKDEVLIAQVRADAGGFWVWAVCDNLRRSSALNAVLAGEKLLFGSGGVN
jgi:aspartate-semialdehyde dehydrogenase